MTTQSDRDLLRRLWSFSMHDDMPIWIAGQLQHLVGEALGAEGASEVDDLLGHEVVELTAERLLRQPRAAQVAEIREWNRRIKNNEEWI